MFLTILIFIVILGILVFVHELGHFVVARKSGMKVDEFGFGFPPRIAGVQKVEGKWKFVWGHRTNDKNDKNDGSDKNLDNDATIYSINLIPLGGFVRILGENNEGELDPRSFINRPFWGRFLTLVAGVVMNVLLAWALISIGYVIGIPAAVESSASIPSYATLVDPRVAIIETVPDLPADKGGLKAGDIVLRVDGQAVGTVEQLQEYVKSNAGKKFGFDIKRGSGEMNIQVESQANPPEGQGPTGIVLASLGTLTVPWYYAPWEGFKTTGTQIWNILSGFWNLFIQPFINAIGMLFSQGRIDLHFPLISQVGGPVKIAQLTGEVADMGFIYLLQFTAFLSLNLAVLNIMPFPALDGGRVAFLIIEKIRGKRNNQKFEQIVNATGFALLLLLMLLVTVKDIIRK